MPLTPGNKRTGVAYNPSTYYLTPDVALKKLSDPTHIHELARIADAVSDKQYAGVVFVGDVDPEDFIVDTGSNRFAGYLGAPFEKLSLAYTAAQTRFGTLSASNRVLILIVGAQVIETSTIFLNNAFIDIFGLGNAEVKNTVEGQPLFSLSGADNVRIHGLKLSAAASPLFYYPNDCVQESSIVIEECELVDTTTEDPTLVGLIHSDINIPPTVLKRCKISSGVRPFYYHSSSVSSLLFEAYNCEFLLGSSPHFTVGESYSRFKMKDCRVVTSQDVSFCSTVSTSGTGNIDIQTSVFEGNHTLRMMENCLNASVTMSNVYCNNFCIIAASVSTGVSLSGTIRSSYIREFSCQNPQLRLQNFNIDDVCSDVQMLVSSMASSCSFKMLRTTSPLLSNVDQTAVLSSEGSVAGSFVDCHSSYRLVNTMSVGVFCGLIQGGSSYGIGRLASLMAPIRQAIVRDHFLYKKGFPINASEFTSFHYPDLYIAGTVDQDHESPVILQGIHSDGLIDLDVPDMEDTPNRQVFMSDCSFSNREGVLQALFPSVTSELHAAAEQRIFISGVSRFPAEDGSVRLTEERTVQYAEEVASRFGDLWLGSSLHRTVIDGATYYITNPRSFREQLGIFYVIFYCRIAGGTTSIDLTHPKFSSATLLNFTAETGLSDHRIGLLENRLPARYAYIGDNTIRISLSEPEIGCSHLDFAAQMGNDLAEVYDDVGGSGLISREGYVYVDSGSDYADIEFDPAFTAIPSLVGDLTVLKPTAGDTDLFVTLDHSSISAEGFRVYLNAAPSVSGYKVKWRATL